MAVASSISNTRSVVRETLDGGLRSRYEIVSLAFALILLGAAGLKAYSLAVRAAHEPQLTESDAIAIAAIGIEWVLGGWLVSGAAKTWARRAAIILLAIFVCVAGFRLFSGEVDCGCFGPIHIHPGWALSLDLLVLTGMVAWGHKVADFSSRKRDASKRLWVGVIVMGLAAAIAAPISVRAVFASPPALSGLVADSMVCDFGELSPQQASLLQHKFVVKNVTNKPIKILKVTASCGCTTASTSKNELAPGGSLALPVEVKWGDRNGPQTAAIWVDTDEDVHARLTLNISATVRASLAVLPNKIDFGNLLPGRSSEQSFKVRIDELTNAKDLHVEASDPSVIIRSIDEPTPENRFLRYTAQVTAGVDEGYHYGIILIRTTSRANPLRLQISYHSEGAISPSVRSVFFDLLNHPVDRTTQIYVKRNLGSSPIEAFVIPATCKAIQVTCVNEPEGGTIELQCDQSETSSPITKCIIRIQSGMYSCDIPVFALCKANPMVQSQTHTSQERN
jgi:hypothetical protein